MLELAITLYLGVVSGAVRHRLIHRHQPMPAVVRTDERGITIVEWMVMGIVAVAAMVVLRAGIIDLGNRILTFIGDQLGI